MLLAHNAQANFTAEAQRRQRREELYVFVLLAFGGRQRKGEQPPKASRTKAEKKAVKPLANRSRHHLYARCFSRADCFLCKEEWARDGLLLRPSPLPCRVYNAGKQREAATDGIAGVNTPNRISRHWPESP